MAEHFEEIVDLRLRALETRFESELMAIEKHFQELQVFWSESLDKTEGRLQTQIGGLRADFNRLDQRLDNYQASNRLEHQRLEDKMDAHHEATMLVLRDILRRLPPAATP